MCLPPLLNVNRDVPTYTRLTMHLVKQTQHIPCRQPFAVVQHYLLAMFDRVERVTDGGDESVVVGGAVTVSMRPPDRVLLSWSMSPGNDMLADAVAAVLLQARSGLSSVKRE